MPYHFLTSLDFPGKAVPVEVAFHQLTCDRRRKGRAPPPLHQQHSDDAPYTVVRVHHTHSTVAGNTMHCSQGEKSKMLTIFNTVFTVTNWTSRCCGPAGRLEGTLITVLLLVLDVQRAIAERIVYEMQMTNKHTAMLLGKHSVPLAKMIHLSYIS